MKLDQEKKKTVRIIESETEDSLMSSRGEGNNRGRMGYLYTEMEQLKYELEDVLVERKELK
jgi:hypothetical protein